MRRLSQFLFGLWLAALLSGCALYDKVFHPRRLGNPSMTPEMKAKMRAAYKASHEDRSSSLKAAEKDKEKDQDAEPDPAAGATGTPDVAVAAEPTKDKNKDKTLTYDELPAGTRTTYNKQGLLKKPLYPRKPVHRYNLRPKPPRAVSRQDRKLRNYVRLEPRARPESAPGARPKPQPLNTYKTPVPAAPKKVAPKVVRPEAPPVRAPRKTAPKTARPAAPPVRPPKKTAPPRPAPAPVRPTPRRQVQPQNARPPAPTRPDSLKRP